MESSNETLPLLARLERFGDPRKTWKWQTGEVDYIRQFGLTAADVPELIGIAQKWGEQTDWPDDDDYVAGFAPIHAWRGLAQLKAADAVPVLLEMMNRLSKIHDDWYLDEFPYVFAWIGPSLIGALRGFLADEGHGLYPRTAAADALCKMAERHPQQRDAAVQELCNALTRFETTDETLNAFLIGYLLDLKATEAAELIERAYAANCVDFSINGNWDEVRKELGVEGLGLVPKELAGRGYSLMGDGDGGEEDFGDEDFGDEDFGDEDFDDGFEPTDDARDDFAPPDPVTAPIRSERKVGRNEPCPCGSGKKYKKCCGK